MNELEFLNIVTSIISDHVEALDIDSNSVKYPNTEISEIYASNFVEVLVSNYTAIKTNLKGSKRVYGCVTFRVISSRGVGSAEAMSKAIDLSKCLSGKIINGIVFDEYELRVLNHTLSQTQTTTDIPYFQVNANIDFSYPRG